MTARPSVSVVIPTGARWGFAVEAVRTALRQEDVDVEVIVVANGPGSDAPPAAPELDDPRVHVLRFPEWRGLARARNVGLAAAHGTWVAFLDDDDRWAPDKLHRQVAAAVAAGTRYAYTGVAVVDASMALLWTDEAPDPEAFRTGAASQTRIPAMASNVLVATDLAREIGGFDETLRHFADWDVEIALAASGRGARVDAPLLAYVQHGANMHVADLGGIEHEQALLEAKHAAAGRRIGSVHIHRWLAGGYREAGRPAAAARTYLRAAWRYRSAPDAVRAAAVLVRQEAMTGYARRRGTRVAGETPAWLAAER